jgi:hypothetical protein
MASRRPEFLSDILLFTQTALAIVIFEKGRLKVRN